MIDIKTLSFIDIEKQYCWLLFVKNYDYSWLVNLLNSNFISALITGFFAIWIGKKTLEKQDNHSGKQVEIQKRIALFDKRLEFANKILKEIDKIAEFFSILLGEGLPRLTKEDLESSLIPSKYHNFFIKNYDNIENIYTALGITKRLQSICDELMENPIENSKITEADLLINELEKYVYCDDDASTVSKKPPFFQSDNDVKTILQTFYKIKQSIPNESNWGYNIEYYFETQLRYIKNALRNKAYNMIKNKEIDFTYNLDLSMFLINFCGFDGFSKLKFESKEKEEISRIERFKKFNFDRINILLEDTFIELEIKFNNVLENPEWGVLSLDKARKEVKRILQEDLQENIIDKINSVIKVIEKLYKKENPPLEKIQKAQEFSKLLVRDGFEIPAIKKITEMREKIEKVMNKEIKLELDDIT